MTEWTLRRLEEQRIAAGKAGRIFTLRGTYPRDNFADFPLSDEAQELIFEGEHLHHYGDEFAPDPRYLRKLVSTIFQRRPRSDTAGATANLP